VGLVHGTGVEQSSAIVTCRYSRTRCTLTRLTVMTSTSLGHVTLVALVVIIIFHFPSAPLIPRVEIYSKKTEMTAVTQ